MERKSRSATGDVFQSAEKGGNMSYMLHQAQGSWPTKTHQPTKEVFLAREIQN